VDRRVRVPAEEDVAALKRRLSPWLLEMDGVSGIGLPAGWLTVYLKKDDAELRRRIELMGEVS
jgi:hypothetical protein